MTEVVYEIRVHRTVEELLTYSIPAPAGDVDAAIDAALMVAKAGFDSEAVVDVTVVGNVHGSDGSLWA